MNSSDPERGYPGALDRLREHERRRGTADPVFSIDRYDIFEILGEGAAAVVYRARDRQLGRSVALKMLRAPLASVADIRERFQREARVMASLSHPNLVAVHDEGEAGGQGYLVMELVDGEPLDRVMKRGGATIASMAALLQKAARGVAAAHDHGIVHRDLKPSNILVTRDGSPKVADFGLARAEGGSELTRTGSILGTPLYMAPEQVGGHQDRIGARTDVYALGAILYEMLTGRPPHTGGSVTEIYQRILLDDPAAPASINGEAPRELSIIAMKALEKEPGRRYANAGDFADDLLRYAAGEPVLARPLSRIDRAGRWIRRRPALSVSIPAGIAALLLAGLLAVREIRTGREREATRLFESGREAVEKAERYLRTPGAEHAELMKRIGPARGLVERGMGLAPGLPGGPLMLGRIREMTGDLAGAEEAYRRAVGLDGRLGAARERLGRLLWTRSFLSYSRVRRDFSTLAVEGVEQIDLAIALPGAFDGDLRKAVAAAMLAYGRDGGQAHLPRLREELAKHRGGEGEEELWLLLGLFSGGDEAMKAFDAALGLHPGLVVAWLSRGVLRMDHGEYRQAIGDFDAAIRIQPTLAGPWVNRGECRRLLGEAEAAAADFAEAIRLDGRDPRPWSSRAMLKMDRKDPGGAFEDVGRALELDPDDAFALNLRGMLRGARGDRAGELADYERAIRLDPRAPEPRANRGTLRGEQGDFAGALEDLASALRLAPAAWPQRPRIEALLRQARQRLGEKR